MCSKFLADENNKMTVHKKTYPLQIEILCIWYALAVVNLARVSVFFYSKLKLFKICDANFRLLLFIYVYMLDRKAFVASYLQARSCVRSVNNICVCAVVILSQAISPLCRRVPKIMLCQCTCTCGDWTIDMNCATKWAYLRGGSVKDAIRSQYCDDARNKVSC